MKWKKCILQTAEEIGTDALGNPVMQWIDVKETVARFTPWTDEQIALEGREVTENEQRFAIPISYDNFPICDCAVIDGKSRDITQKIDLPPRYTVIQVKVYKE